MARPRKLPAPIDSFFAQLLVWEVQPPQNEGEKVLQTKPPLAAADLRLESRLPGARGSYRKYICQNWAQQAPEKL